MIPFLSARWKHLLLANYAVDPDVIGDLVPQGTALDRWEGRVFVSLVAFRFENTRVLGLPVPFHRHFDEVNLRFYVSPLHDRTLRAVTFVTEIVPRRAIPWVANTLFSENYVAMPMASQHEASSHSYKWGTALENRFSVTIDRPLSLPTTGSAAEFITEHYWGYTQARRSTLEYQVQHPPWESCEVSQYQIEVDFERLYGRRFAFLNAQAPDSVLYALGSSVAVSFPGRLRQRLAD